jgi:hypothetical protein
MPRDQREEEGDVRHLQDLWCSHQKAQDAIAEWAAPCGIDPEDWYEEFLAGRIALDDELSRLLVVREDVANRYVDALTDLDRVRG